MSTMTDYLQREEARLRAELARERESNRHYAARCPGVKETECYRKGPLSPANYYTTSGYLLACIDREQTRFNPARCERRRAR